MIKGREGEEIVVINSGDDLIARVLLLTTPFPLFNTHFGPISI